MFGHIGYALAFLVFVGLAAYGITTSIIEDRAKTPQQKALEVRQAEVNAALERQRRRAQGDATRENLRWQKQLCAEAQVCARYAVARQECAVAADFKNCVEVKTGTSTGAQTCTDDGRVHWGLDASVPYRITCLVYGLTDYFPSP